MFTVNDLVRTIDTAAPYKYALSWDNSGFLVGHADQEVLKVLVSLDFTEAVLDEAIEKGANVIVTHHPYFFKPIARLTDETAKGRLVLRLIENHISLLCAHTNLDVAHDGINDLLCEMLGLQNVIHAGCAYRQKYYKIVFFVPEGHQQAVIDALGDAGAGRLGCYTRCSFVTKGEGRFQPLDGAQPFIGTPGMVEQVPEYRVEAIVEEELLNQTVQAGIGAHPYEQPAYDILPNEVGQTVGEIRIGEYDGATTLKDFLETVRNVLKADKLSYAGTENALVKRVAVCSGSGADFLELAKGQGADTLLTADARYHDYQLANELSIHLIDAGHFETETIICTRLAELFRQNGLSVEVSQAHQGFYKVFG